MAAPSHRIVKELGWLHVKLCTRDKLDLVAESSGAIPLSVCHHSSWASGYRTGSGRENPKGLR